MAEKKSVVMMTNTTGQYTYTGEAVRADSWWGYTDGLHTVSVKYANFKGFFGIEGTLSTSPTENDWFPIYLNSGSTCCPQVEFLYETGIQAYTFLGNFVFLRAVMSRENLDPIPDQIAIQSLGTIDKVLLAM